MGTQKDRYTMAYIKAADGRVIADEVEIHNMVTSHFNEWFAMPEYAKESSLHLSDS